MHKCPMLNAQLPMTNCQLYLIRYMLHDSFFKRVEVYGLFPNGAIISYWGNAGESISSVL